MLSFVEKVATVTKFSASNYEIYSCYVLYVNNLPSEALLTTLLISFL